MSCNVTLLRRESKVACVAERSFGCVDERTLWTKGCRGRFLCAGVAIACGYARHHQHIALRLGRRIECRCDSRCVEGNASAEQESLAPVTLRIEGERRRRSPALEVRTRAVGRAAMAPSWWRRWSSPQRTR